MRILETYSRLVCKNLIKNCFRFKLEKFHQHYFAPGVCCFSTYLSYCHWTALFDALTTSWLGESALAKEFPAIQCSCGFLGILDTEFVAYSKPPSRDNHRKASYSRTQQRDHDAG